MRHRGRWWTTAASTRVRYYSRHANAAAFADRMRDAGHDVELSYVRVGRWTVTRPAAFTVEVAS